MAAVCATRGHCFHWGVLMFDLLDLALPSTGWFILVGVFIGFFFWYRDSASESHILKVLERRYVRARYLARQRKKKFLDLQADHQATQANLKHTRDRQEALSKRSCMLERSLHKSTAELEQIQLEKQSSDDLLVAEQQRSESLVTQLEEVMQTETALQQELEDKQQTIEQQQQSSQSIESEYEQVRDDLRAQIDAATHSLTEQDKQIEQLQIQVDELLPLRAQLANANLSLADQRSQTAELAEIIETQENDLDLLRGSLQSTELVKCELATVVSELSETKDRCEALQTEHQEGQLALVHKQRELQKLTKRVERLEPLEKDHAEATEKINAHRQSETRLRSHVTARQSEIERLEERLSERCDEVSNLQQQLREQHAQQLRLSEDNAVRGSTIEQLQSEVGQLSERLSDQASEISKLRQDLQQQQTDQASLSDQNADQASIIKQLHAEIAQLRQLADQFEATQGQIESLTEELVSVTNERDELSKIREELDRAVTQLRTQVATRSSRFKAVSELLKVKTRSHSRVALKLQKQVESQVTELNVLRGRLVVKSERQEQLDGDLASFKQRLDQSQVAVEELRDQLEVTEKLQSENSELQNQVESLAADVHRLGSELGDNMNSNARAQDRIRDLEYQVHEYAMKIRGLRRELRLQGGRRGAARSGGRRAA
jgi:chromosome segregation ATPase